MGDPATLDEQLIRGDITQLEYDRAIEERKPLTVKTKGGKVAERKERDQLFFDRIYARRKEVEKAIKRAKELYTGPAPSPKAVTRGGCRKKTSSIAKSSHKVGCRKRESNS